MVVFILVKGDKKASVNGSGGRENQISQGTMNASNVIDLFKFGRNTMYHEASMFYW